MWWDAMRSPAARWNHPKAVEKTVPWKPWKTKPRFPTAPTAPWKTRNLGEFPTFPPPCDSLFPSLKKTKGQEGSMKQADRSSVNKSGQIQKLPTARVVKCIIPLVDPLPKFFSRSENSCRRDWCCLGGGGVVGGAEPASFEAVRGAAEARGEVGGGQAGRGAGPGESRAVLARADDEGRAAVGWAVSGRFRRTDPVQRERRGGGAGDRRTRSRGRGWDPGGGVDPAVSSGIRRREREEPVQRGEVIGGDGERSVLMLRHATTSDVPSIRTLMEMVPGFWQPWWSDKTIDNAIRSAEGLTYRVVN